MMNAPQEAYFTTRLRVVGFSFHRSHTLSSRIAKSMPKKMTSSWPSLLIGSRKSQNPGTLL